MGVATMVDVNTSTERRFFATSDGIRIAFYVDDFTDPWKQPQTLFITHPAMSSARRLYAFVPRLARHYRVVRMELRGHGASQVPPSHLPLTRERLLQDLLELQAHMGVERAHFLGAAGGGYLAQWMAIAKPEQVLSIMLFASKPGLKHSQAASWIPRIESTGLRAFLMETIEDRFPPGYPDHAHIAWFVDEIMRNDVEFIKRFILTMTGLYWMDEVDAIKCPTLIVKPGEEPIGDGSAYEEMHERIPASELLVYEGGRHNIGDYLADRCAADALSFLRRHFP
jgi:pimeloyl-ACP methyl ester carboxylesterase